VWGLVAGLVIGVAAGLLVPRLFDDSDPMQERIAELKEADRQRDRELTEELVGLAEQARDHVVPVLTATSQPGHVPSGEEVGQWRGAVQQAAELFAERPSGGTAVNLARSGFAGSVTTLQHAVQAYSDSLKASGENGDRLRELAAELRDDAVVEWSLAANQLDVAGVEAGVGHVHVFLPPQGVEGELAEHGHP
jgi:hypothetical protein